MATRTVDYIYRYDPQSPAEESVPPDAAAARAELERGNGMFAGWVECCRAGAPPAGESPFVVNCNHIAEVLGWAPGAAPKHRPFGIVVGCSDARVPVEMVLGQSLNELFVVRVAGNVVDSAGKGSIDYALEHLGKSVRVVVVLGHAGCGAVTGAVDSYLKPTIYWDAGVSQPLRSILRRIVLVVHEAASALERAYGPGAANLPGYRQALIDLAISLNAAQTAHDLRQDVERDRRPVRVLYGVYDLRSGALRLPGDDDAEPDGRGTLLDAPAHPSEFLPLADRLARRLRAVLHGPAPA